MTSPNQTPTAPSTLKRAYQAMDRMSRKLEEYERAESEPIAIVGLGCRFPGGAVDAQSYWSVLSTGTDAVSEIPADRWDVAAFYSEKPQQSGKMSTRWGGFLDHLDQFDHDFFGISRREALAMDPQQRLALEVAWEALENAGQAPAELAGSRTGVFMGVCSYDFAARHYQRPRDLTAYASTGAAHSVVTGRLSYLLDLKGPSLAIDSACSSSLVAVHLAAQSLRRGECDLALSGGVNVVLSPLPSISFSQFPGMVSAEGRCKTFDAGANGYVRSEGCGIVVLKRLSDAVRDGDVVLAVLRGGAVNQDGRSSGVTAPNGLAQRDVLRRALDSSGVAADEVSYIEAHGTGTRLGDPIEVEALAEVYGRDQGSPVFLGSSKTNIGHLEAAAGIAGLIKVVLALGRAAIPANVHFTELNPHISFEGTTFAVPTRLTPWPAARSRIAGVSSFGFSGTNAHLILEQAPSGAAAAVDERRPSSVLALSAKSPKALVALARRYERRLLLESADSADSSTPIADLCYSANTGRSHFRHRLAAVGASRSEIAEQLADFADGLPGEVPVAGEVASGGTEVVFLFTGQGPQRVGMARELYLTQPTFAKWIDLCDDITRPLLETPLLSVIYPEDSGDGPASDLINQTEYSQPALFAIEYATAQLWRSWGVEPVAVLGHSFGEYVAACVAGAMSLEDGLKLVVARGRLMQKLSETGTMAVVFASERDVVDAIAEYRDKVSIAAVNGPSNTSISGERDAVTSICEAFTGRGVRAKQLHITTASHSPLIEPVLDELRRAAEAVTFVPPRIPLVSNLTGALWPWDETPDPEYWCRHAREPVRFAEGLATLRELGYGTFLEVGPAPTLLGLISENQPADGDLLLLPSLRPKQADWAVMLATAAQLYVHGAGFDWRGFDRDYARTRVPVPTYAFDPTPCWKLPAQDQAEPAPAELEQNDDHLLYQLEWQSLEAAEPAAKVDAENQAWLLLADDTTVADQLAALIAARGSQRCLRLPTAANVAELRRALGELELTPADRLQVVHLSSLEDLSPGLDPVAEMLRAQEQGTMTAVRAVQALADPTGAGSARLWLVTRGAVQPTLIAQSTQNAQNTQNTQPRLALAQSTLWGLGRSLQQEHAGLWGALIDLDPEAEPRESATQLLAALDRSDTEDGETREDQFAFRGHDGYVARLVRAPLTDLGTANWRPDASYLITGGLGGVGLAVARSLVQAGARRLVLLGRSLLPPRSQWADIAATDPAATKVNAVRELESLGASVVLESVDVADEGAMSDFLRRFDAAGWPPIRGVIHAAGMGEVAPVVDLDRAELGLHLRPKAIGAWVLHRLFNQRPLDFFVLFSSTSSILSSPFVASYAAANAFLDGLAQQRRNDGRPGLSINWGIWADTGLAARGADVTPGLSRGMGTLEPDQALRVLHQLLRQQLRADQAQIAVVPVDWAEWGRRYRDVSGSALLSTLLADPDPSVRRPGRASSQPSLIPTREVLLALPVAERAEVMSTQLRASVAATLGSQPSAIGLDQPLFDLGLDSLMAVELRNRIEGPLGVSLPISILLEGASVRVVADQIVARLSLSQNDADPGLTAITRVPRAEDLVAAALAQLDEQPGHTASVPGRR